MPLLYVCILCKFIANWRATATMWSCYGVHIIVAWHLLVNLQPCSAFIKLSLSPRFLLSKVFLSVTSRFINGKLRFSICCSMQTSMSVPLVMEGVVVPVSTLLVATTVHVPQDARWTPMVMLVMVSCI